jgi:predicted transposase/invertase (TIGR01784 family)
MPDLLDPKNDYVFKRLFADAPGLLVALINAVRDRAPPITAVEVKNPSIDPAELRGKYIILDLLAVDAAGGHYNIEMQVRRFAAWSARSTYYLARLLSTQLVPGDDYTELRPVIGIHLLDFDLFRAPEHGHQAHWCFEMRDADTPSVTLGHELQLHLIELRKADRLRLAPAPLAAWITLFEHWQEDDTMSQLTDEPVRAAFNKLKHLSADTEARRLAFVRERALRDELTLLKEARAEGQTEGRAEGEAAARRTMVLDLVCRTGLDDTTIAAVTRLSTEEVAGLRTKMRESTPDTPNTET